MRELKDTEKDLHDHWQAHFIDRHQQRITKSLEGRYKRENVNDDDKPIARSPIDIKLACTIEKIITTKLPKKEKIIIVTEYMYRWALKDNLFNMFCRKIGIRPQQYDEYLRRAKLMVHNNLNKIEVFNGD
jgi:hypothetical protein